MFGSHSWIIYWGLQSLLCHEKYENDKVDGEGKEYHASMPAHKVYEQFGEAIPQLVIAVTFYANNAHWLPQGDLLFGIFAIAISGANVNSSK